MAASWDDFRFLLALRQAGSLGAAARALKVETSTMSRRLAALEAALGVQLVVRTPDGVKFVEAGLVAAEAAGKIEATITEVEKRVGGADLRAQGVVRVSVTEGMATSVFEGLAALRRREPGICVELVVASGPVDLARGEADIAVRLFRETNGELVAKKVGTIDWSLYASPAYIERHGADVVASDLASCDVVGFSDSAARSPGAKWLEANARGANIVFRGTSVSSVVQAVRAGMGVAPLPCFMAEREGASLTRLTADVIAESEIFLVVHPSQKDVARVRIVLDALGALFARDRSALCSAR